MKYFIVAAILIGASSAQYLVHQHQPIAYNLQPTTNNLISSPSNSPQNSAQYLANPAVVDNSIVESHLPAEYMRASNFYRNPKTAEALAKASWLTDKEMPVFEREADKIPREQVYKIFKNAGFLHSHRR